MDLEYHHESEKCAGLIKLRPTTFKERWKYVEACNFKVNEAGEIEKGAANLPAMLAMVELSRPHYIEASVKLKESGKEFKSFEEMELDNDCDEVLIGAAAFLMNGGKVSKNLKP